MKRVMNKRNWEDLKNENQALTQTVLSLTAKLQEAIHGNTGTSTPKGTGPSKQSRTRKTSGGKGKQKEVQQA